MVETLGPCPLLQMHQSDQSPYPVAIPETPLRTLEFIQGMAPQPLDYPRRVRFCQSVAAPSSRHRVRWFWGTLGNRRLSISRVSLTGPHQSERSSQSSVADPR